TGEVLLTSASDSRGARSAVPTLFRAFAAMQYFGYLLRDPEDAGYNDWVDVLTNAARSHPEISDT
ncbi:MAG TPA: hypothetical protein VJM50_18560, partial [Pyrinomonadaceae bacterium]|nr:hypothetical protein [Pyrinomonadaceae bacterium]